MNFPNQKLVFIKAGHLENNAVGKFIFSAFFHASMDLSKGGILILIFTYNSEKYICIFKNTKTIRAQYLRCPYAYWGNTWSSAYCELIFGKVVYASDPVH